MTSQSVDYELMEKDIYELDESKITLNSSKSELDKLAAKNQLMWYNDARYWDSAIQKGKDCFDALVGVSFSEDERKAFEEQDKIIVEVPAILPKINQLSGFQRNSRRNGVVVAQGPEDTASAEIINVILQSLRQSSNMDQGRSDVFLNGMTSGFPCFMWVDKIYNESGGAELDIYPELWNSTLPDSNFTKSDLSDCQRLTRIRMLTRDQAIDIYPDRSDDIMKYAGKYNGVFDSVNLNSYDTRDQLIQRAQESQTGYEGSGLITIIERTHFIRKNTFVYVSPHDEEAYIPPASWTDEDQRKYEAENPGWMRVRKKVKQLWVTTTTSTGLVLENKAHWLQSGEWPCACFIPLMVNNKPRGWVEFQIDIQKMKNVGRTEFVHSVRFANDKLMIYRGGALRDPEEARDAKATTGGAIEVDEDFEGSLSDAVMFPQDQGGNQGYLELSAVAEDDMDNVTALPPAMGGAMEAANETFSGLSRRIAQSQTAQGPYLDNFNLFDHKLHEVILSALPYCYTEEKVFRYVSDDGTDQTAVVNQPAEVNPMTLEVSRVVNSLDGAKYDYLQAQGDNSITGLENEFGNFMQVSSEILRSLPPEEWSAVLATVPNRFAKEMAQRLTELKNQREQAAANSTPQPDPARVQVQLKGEDLQTPEAQAILQSQGVLPSEQGGEAPVEPQAPTDPIQAPQEVELSPEVIAALQGGMNA